MSHRKHKEKETYPLLVPTYGSRFSNEPVPKYEMPDTEMPPEAAYALVHDQLMLDGNARLNCATFVTTWMEPKARELMAESFDKNMIDKDEYPQTAEIEQRCVRMLANLWHAPNPENTIGCSTTGSSEACMLAGMAMKWRWRERQRQLGKPTDKPNLVMGINVQICWDKFCRYWDVEMRQVPMDGGRYVISTEAAMALCDENTIGVIGILGSTFTGEYEPIAELNDALEQLNQTKGWDIPLHVDAASGGFVAPFIQPNLVWDFRLSRVKSINTSGHKYGLVYPGVGWALWRETADLPEDLIFNVNYLGGQMPTFALNFSRPGNQVVGQYYNLIRLGKSGYRRIQQNCQDVAMYLSGEIAKLGPFELLSDGSELPVFAFKLKEKNGFTCFEISDRLRTRGWQVPAYSLPDYLSDVVVLRIVVKEGFSIELANLLLEDLRRAVDFLTHHSYKEKVLSREGFHH